MSRIDIIGQNGNEGLHYSAMDDYQTFIHKSRYARWREDLGRRETWEETVGRYISFFGERFPELLFEDDPERPDTGVLLGEAILNMEIMPSMRCLMTAGKALERDNVAGYNCAYTVIDTPKAFDEAMYILMCGTGVGFSVENKYVSKLPEVAESFYDTETTISVADSKIGWATAYRELVSLLYQGKIPQWDLSKVRPSGARLKTFGGRASGPEPLESLFKFTVEIFKKAAGRRLTSLECHDIMCKIADAIVVGGVRRSALISLSDLEDPRMREAKSGTWYYDNPQRALANNSGVYTERPDLAVFLREWNSLYLSKSGERGILNRYSLRNKVLQTKRRDPFYDFGCNPCSEIILRPKQFCNLSEVVVRCTDTLEDLKRKVRLATILGTLQSTLTDFRYLSSAWKKNTEEEALLGVSLTGIMDHPLLSGQEKTWRVAQKKGIINLEQTLEELRDVAIDTNREWAKKLGVNESTSITCIKPSGTVSQLVNAASGIHPRYSQYYKRAVRLDKKDSMYQFLVDQGVPHEDEKFHPETTAVFYFPVASPTHAVCRKDYNAIQQLRLWRTYATHFCEHKPSVTIYYTDDNFLAVGDFVYNNFDSLSGVSFLPFSDHVYVQAPYTEITQEEYNDLIATFPKIDWSLMSKYETVDTTSNTKELACSAGSCEVI